MNYDKIKEIIDVTTNLQLDPQIINTMNEGEILNITTRLFEGMPSYARARQLMDTGVLLYRNTEGHYAVGIYAEVDGFYFVDMNENIPRRTRFTTEKELLDLIEAILDDVI